MNEYLIQLLKLNILTLAVYNPALNIEEFLLLRWNDIILEEENVKIILKEQKIIVDDKIFILFLKELYNQDSKEKSDYIFLY